MEKDVEHLRLLSLFHYFCAGITGVLFSLGLLYMLTRGLFKTTFPQESFVQAFFIISIVLLVEGWFMAAMTIHAGRCLGAHKRLGFCRMFAAINCVFLPYGTILGVFTIMVLQRPGVRQFFEPPVI